MTNQPSWQDHAILFDMDGVLISLKKRWIDPIENTISHFKDDFNREAIVKYSSSLLLVHGGNTRMWMLRGIIEICKVGGLSRFQTLRVMIKLGFMLITRKNFKIVPFESTVETLEILKKMGFHLAIVTSSSRATIRTLSKQFPEIYNKFDHTITRSDVRLTKPFPDQLIIALKRLKIEKTRAVMVGDFASDIFAGKNAGIKTIAVLGEFPQINKGLLESSEPDVILRDIKQIPEIISKVFSS